MTEQCIGNQPGKRQVFSTRSASLKSRLLVSGRTQTCNQTVIRGGISTRFVDFAVFLFDFNRVCVVSFRFVSGAKLVRLSNLTEFLSRLASKLHKLIR